MHKEMLHTGLIFAMAFVMTGFLAMGIWGDYHKRLEPHSATFVVRDYETPGIGMLIVSALLATDVDDGNGVRVGLNPWLTSNETQVRFPLGSVVSGFYKGWDNHSVAYLNDLSERDTIPPAVWVLLALCALSTLLLLYVLVESMLFWRCHPTAPPSRSAEALLEAAAPGPAANETASSSPFV